VLTLVSATRRAAAVGAFAISVSFLLGAGGEPVTSGLQILFGHGQPGSSGVDARRLRVWELSHVSRGTDDGHPDLTQL
jgi:hypothetical protein